MIQEQQQVRQESGPRSSRAHWLLELAGIGAFAVLAALIGGEIYLGAAAFGYAWLLPAVAVLAYLAADLASGFVHFLADNFGSEETPILGPNSIEPFRDHHVDPKGITRNDFVDNNGNNCLASAPFMLLVYLFVPVAAAAWGYLFGAFFLMVCLAVFLINQFHKWAHMDTPPGWVVRLQRWGLVLSKEHHDVHHESPYDTYYCITVGVWNPLLDRLRFFERAEHLIRRTIPGTDPLLRSERDGSLNG
jgi:hypothetical protein